MVVRYGSWHSAQSDLHWAGLCATHAVPRTDASPLGDPPDRTSKLHGGVAARRALDPGSAGACRGKSNALRGGAGQAGDEPGLCCPQQHGAPIFAACAGELRLLRPGVQGSDARAVRLLPLQWQAAEHLLASYDPLLLAPSTGGSARRAGLAGPLRVAERAGTARHGRRAGARRSVVATGAAGPTRSPAPRPGAPAAAHRAAYGCLSQGGDPARRIRAATARAGAAGERTG